MAKFKKRIYKHMYVDNDPSYIKNMAKAMKLINAEEGTIVSVTHPHRHRASIIYTVPDKS